MIDKKIFALDIGNSRIHSGIVSDSGIDSYAESPNDEINNINWTNINKENLNCIFSSVNSKITKELIEITNKYQLKAIEITNQNIIKDTYKTLGTDRICDLAAGLKYINKGNVLVFNFGTATTVSSCNAKGEFLGGIIKAGIKLELDSLNNNTSQLPKIDLNKFDDLNISSKDTENAIVSGVLLGQIATIEKYLASYIKEHKSKPYIILTGGFAKLISKHFTGYDLLEPRLSLFGIHHIYQAQLLLTN